MVTYSAAKRAAQRQHRGRSLCFKMHAHQVVEFFHASLGISLPDQWRHRSGLPDLGLTYKSSTHHLYLDEELTGFQNITRRLRLYLPAFAFQIQTISWPRSVTYCPVVPCESQIFKLCRNGDIDMAKMCFMNSLASPFVVDRHGENLLHVSNCSGYSERKLKSEGCSKIRTCGAMSSLAGYQSRRECL
jgi:hypothetical protein